MKKINKILFISLLFFISSCQSIDTNKEEKINVVKKLLAIWINKPNDGFLRLFNKSIGKESRALISPKNCQENGNNIIEYTVNSYGIQDYKIVNTDANFVNVIGIRNQPSWKIRMKFEVTKEKGKYYILPSKWYTTEKGLKYVNPWIEVEKIKN